MPNTSTVILTAPRISPTQPVSILASMCTGWTMSRPGMSHLQRFDDVLWYNRAFALLSCNFVGLRGNQLDELC